MSVLLGVVIICQWHYILYVMYEITQILDIRVFKVKPVIPFHSLINVS